jgi:hypothetical protein
MLNSLNIKHKITKKINSKKQKCSVIVLSNKKSIVDLGSYIYKNFNKDKIGLIRKYKKLSQIAS